MKKLNFLLKTLLALSIILNYSCESEKIDVTEPNTLKYEASTISAAQDLFNTNTPSSSGTQRFNSLNTLVDWENSKSKTYKRTEEIDVDIYTPQYI